MESLETAASGAERGETGVCEPGKVWAEEPVSPGAHRDSDSRTVQGESPGHGEPETPGHGKDQADVPLSTREPAEDQPETLGHGEDQPETVGHGEDQPDTSLSPKESPPASLYPKEPSKDHLQSPEEPSSSLPSPSPDAPSLDSLESFSNLPSCPSSGEEEGSAGRDRYPGQSVYHMKWIRWKEQSTPIVTQNENGPCPLLAIMNVLLLAWKIKLPPMIEIITAEQLMEYLGDYILEAKPKEISEVQRLNYEQNMSDAMAILHKLQTGLDVNVKFTGVRVFEYTPECIVFDLLDIPLYHGWLVDPQIPEVATAVGNCSYNQLVEKIISCKQSDNSELVSEGFVAEQFLYGTATQLTYHGLTELTTTLQEGELCVFFRNNHFSTMTKYKGQLYLLVTDQGFLTEENIIWESLHNVDGDGNFCDSEFHLRPPSDPETVYQGQQDQIDQDYLMALSLQQEQQNQDVDWEQIPEGISDLELAKKLQEEEDRRASQFYQEQEQEQAAASAVAQPGPQANDSPSSSRPPGSSERKKKEPKEKEKEKNTCVLL